jgi:hypothetical protein
MRAEFIGYIKAAIFARFHNVKYNIPAKKYKAIICSGYIAIALRKCTGKITDSKFPVHFSVALHILQA